MLNDFDSSVISFAAHNAKNVEVHRHHCFQIVAAVKGDFACTIGRNSFTRKKRTNQKAETAKSFLMSDNGRRSRQKSFGLTGDCSIAFCN
ncbi:MAG: hypothetical protein ACR2LT_05315 [Pyrinomonadaceae bacterium]